MRIRVDVTADHITRGARENCWTCPVALAIDSALVRLGRSRDASVRTGRMRVNGRYYPTPDSVRGFIAAFDRGGPAAVAPISFDLEVPIP